MSLPIVAIVGRPNVGKSSLLNCIARRMISIVEPTPGVTRDRVTTICEADDVYFELVDTGGYGVKDSDNLTADIERQIALAIAQANLILFTVDVKDGIVPLDQEVARLLRPHGDRVQLVVNKVDQPTREAQSAEFMRLGFGEPLLISALHGYGRAELIEAIVARVRSAFEAAPPDPVMHVAVIGRQNTGKSTFINALAGEERMIVSEVPGTTRDAVDAPLTWHGRRFRIVDTAGIRRPGRVARSGKVEAVSVLLAQRSIEAADIVVLVVDAAAGATDQDAAIAGAADRAGRGVVIVANKWDLVKGQGPEFVKTFDAALRQQLKFLDYAPILHLSALTGERISKLLETIARVEAARRVRVRTPELNRLVERIAREHPPASPGRRHVRILYATQTGVAPPTFVFFTNVATSFHFSYQRFLENRLREAFGFEGTPIRILVRARRRTPREQETA